MRSGVVDGMESATGASLAFGMGDSIGQIIKNNWSIAGEVLWANVDWLKGLSDEQRNALASATKEASENVIHMYREHMLNDIGEQQPPPEGSRLAELDIMVTAPSESEMEQWKEPVDPQKNPKKYEDIIGGSNIGGKEFYDYLYNAARSGEVPTNYEDFAPQSWWDKHLDDI
jgi:TRAP-type C4-dicarboxylate transport system substrate-binding protein